MRFSRVRHVLPISTIGYTHRLPPMTTSIPELFLVNSAHILNGTLNVDETIKLANVAMTVLVGLEDATERQAATVPASIIAPPDPDARAA